jgi:hypothetical protein
VGQNRFTGFHLAVSLSWGLQHAQSPGGVIEDFYTNIYAHRQPNLYSNQHAYPNVHTITNEYTDTHSNPDSDLIDTIANGKRDPCNA